MSFQASLTSGGVENQGVFERLWPVLALV